MMAKAEGKRNYYEANKEACKDYQRRYYREHEEYYSSYSKEYRLGNLEYFRDYMRGYRRSKRHENQMSLPFAGDLA